MNFADRIESLLALKYDMDFYMTVKSWDDYLVSIGVSRTKPEGPNVEMADPESFGSGGPLRRIFVPFDVGIKILALGHLP